MTLIDPPIPDDEVTLAERAIAGFSQLDEDWSAVDGGVEEQMAEALATPVATAAYVVRESMRGAYADVVGRVVRVQREAAAQSTAIATITVTSSAGVTLPAGRDVGLTLNGDEVPFVLAEDVVYAASQTVATGVRLVAVDPGPETIGASDPAKWTDAQIASIDVTTSAYGGQDEEDDDSYLARIEARASRRVSLAPTNAPSFAEAALDDEEVGRCAYRNRFDPGAPSTPTRGHVTLWPITVAGANISAPGKARLAAQFAGDDDPLGVEVHLEDPPRVNVAIAVQVTKSPDYSEAEAEAAIEAEIPARLGPAVFNYSGTAPGRWIVPDTASITGFDVAAAIDDLPQVVRVHSATVNAGSAVTFSDPVTLPTITGITVTFA